jgi:hypothetical protein
VHLLCHDRLLLVVVLVVVLTWHLTRTFVRLVQAGYKESQPLHRIAAAAAAAAVEALFLHLHCWQLGLLLPLRFSSSKRLLLLLLPLQKHVWCWLMRYLLWERLFFQKRLFMKLLRPFGALLRIQCNDG